VAKNYHNPPIEEAICEFTFGAQESGKFDFTLPGKLQSHPNLKDEYVGEVRTQNVQKIIANPNEPSISVHDSISRIQLPTIDGKRLVSVGSNILGVSVLKPYEGWNDFKPRIRKALEAYYEVAKPSFLTRIGIRYINRIVISQTGVDPKCYLANVLTSYPEANQVLTSFLYRSEYVKADNTKIIVTQATLRPVDDETTEYLIDIDSIWDHASVHDIESTMEITEKLHISEGEAFEKTITDASRRLFDAG
jgi:uncharacterized protein (TIGR04255 family)